MLGQPSSEITDSTYQLSRMKFRGNNSSIKSNMACLKQKLQEEIQGLQNKRT